MFSDICPTFSNALRPNSEYYGIIVVVCNAIQYQHDVEYAAICRLDDNRLHYRSHTTKRAHKYKWGDFESIADVK